MDVEEESESEKRYAETKELLIPVLRMVPVKTTIQRLNLLDMLKYCSEYAKFISFFSFLFARLPYSNSLL